MVRKSYADTEAAIDPVLTMTTENGRAIIDGASGTVTLTLADEDTAAVPFGTYRYDVELESAAGDVTRLVQGTFTISPEVTR